MTSLVKGKQTINLQTFSFHNEDISESDGDTSQPDPRRSEAEVANILQRLPICNASHCRCDARMLAKVTHFATICESVQAKKEAKNDSSYNDSFVRGNDVLIATAQCVSDEEKTI